MIGSGEMPGNKTDSRTGFLPSPIAVRSDMPHILKHHITIHQEIAEYLSTRRENEDVRMQFSMLKT
jgi:hypothetical protein